MRFTDVRFVCWKKIIWAVFEKNSVFIFWGPLKFLLASKTLFGIRNPNFGGVILLTFFDWSNGLKVENFIFWLNPPWESRKLLLGSKNLRSMTPPKFEFLIQNKVLEANKNFRGPQKMKKTVFLKNGPTNFFPTNKSDISEAHRDLLHWNLSWAFPFNILVYEEGSA